MAKRKAAKKGPATAKPARGEPRVIVLAERLGSFLGRVRKKADGWTGKSAKAAAKPAKRVVPAAGKRARKPPAEELFDPRLGEPMGKQMGQKTVGKGRGARS